MNLNSFSRKYVIREFLGGKGIFSLSLPEITKELSFSTFNNHQVLVVDKLNLHISVLLADMNLFPQHMWKNQESAEHFGEQQRTPTSFT